MNARNALTVQRISARFLFCFNILTRPSAKDRLGEQARDLLAAGIAGHQLGRGGGHSDLVIWCLYPVTYRKQRPSVGHLREKGQKYGLRDYIA